MNDNFSAVSARKNRASVSNIASTAVQINFLSKAPLNLGYT